VDYYLYSFTITTFQKSLAYPLRFKIVLQGTKCGELSINIHQIRKYSYLYKEGSLDISRETVSKTEDQ
jgi:hypothetical protein